MLSGSVKNITTADGVHAITFGEETREIFDYNQNAKNTMSQIQNQDFLFRPFVSTAVSMKSNGGVRIIPSF
ncbi:MAG TPA: hypothetical protein VFY68_15260 [Nitrososphaeraceae archaeon]|nr:hypothetical protein [Nitrososphaeraceae archaeon]